MGHDIQRRDVLKFTVAGLALVPCSVRAQQAGKVSRVALVFGGVAGDPDLDARILAIQSQMIPLGWIDGQNIRYDVYYAQNNPERARAIAHQILAATPDVILSAGTIPTMALHAVIRRIPIVFVNVTDPVAGGFVTSLARPGGNITGFTPFEYPIAGKWLSLLRELAPDMTRVALLGGPLNHNFKGFWAEFEPAARKAGLEPVKSPAGDAAEIERNLRAFSSEPKGGLVISAAQFSLTNRDLITGLAAQLKLPTIYWSRFFPKFGGLISYGPNSDKLHGRSATYIDRILRGEKPESLPVQEPVDFETVLNAKTARALGLTISTTLLAQADEVIE